MLGPMALNGPFDHLADDIATQVASLARRTQRSFGHTPIGGDGWDQLRRGRSGRFGAAWSTGPNGEIEAYAQLTRRQADHAWAVEVLVSPEASDRLVDLGGALVSMGLRWAAAQGGGHVHFWATDARPAHAELAARVGLDPHRTLHQMRRPLPTDPPGDTELRSFEPGDEDELLEVNRLAFANHPDQGDMTRDMFDERVAEDWFDPKGLLIFEEDGRIGGFCWTKLFADADPVMGEIHIICVHPDFGGRGLGRDLVLAGLAYLHQQGAEVGFLFVEGDNQAALDLYTRLGFEVTRTDRAFAATLPA